MHYLYVVSVAEMTEHIIPEICAWKVMHYLYVVSVAEMTERIIPEIYDTEDHIFVGDNWVILGSYPHSIHSQDGLYKM